jgi:hypothetical protein
MKRQTDCDKDCLHCALYRRGEFDCWRQRTNNVPPDKKRGKSKFDKVDNLTLEEMVIVYSDN